MTDEKESTLDFTARYTVDGYPGIAFYLAGYEQVFEAYTYTDDEGNEWADEDGDGEWVDNTDRVRAIMVGDDTVHSVGVDELTPISEDDYCDGCGQVGCGWGSGSQHDDH